jgi:hypothetical protein
MFEVKDYIPREEKVRLGYRVVTEAFEITTFTTGDYQIPSLRINYRSPDGREKTIATDPISIRVKSLLSGEDAEDVRPLRAPKAFSRGFPYWLAAVAAVVIVGIVAFIILYRRAGKPIELTAEPRDTRLPWEIAIAELALLWDTELVAKGEFKLFYLKLTEVFRRYLEKRYGISALERTTWEITLEFRRQGFPPDEEKVVREFLDDCDLVKFAKFIPTSEQAEHDFQRAREFVLQTRSLPYASTPARGA